ncbi:hypothetical protein GQR58_017208 [Nymphon striatum]|nr:hypothetical protein GQR58_017208 [Nymphon striatum]
MRKPEKPQLAKAIDDYACSLSDEAVTNEVPQTESYVLDGSSKVQWTKGSTYGAIADCYVDFTLRNYGMATVVFDGYHDQPSVKDSTHQRRQQKNHPKVSFTPTTVFTGKKEEFLSQGSNKQGLINMISDRLREKGCKVMNAEGDADYDIVQAAIALSEYKTTTLIGEDTDLLILLLHHMDSHKKTLYFRSDKKSKEQRVKDELSKNHQMPTKDTPTGRIMPEIPNARLDPVNCFLTYISKLNPLCEALFQRLKVVSTQDEVWYYNAPLGKNTLSDMMKTISINAKLDYIYTNHCIRATTITNLHDSYVSAEHITTISKHKSVESYWQDTTIQQKHKIALALSSPMDIKPILLQGTANPPVAHKKARLAESTSKSTEQDEHSNLSTEVCDKEFENVIPNNMLAGVKFHN